MKTMKKLFFALAVVAVMASLLAFSVFADETGYTFDSDGATRTNIKWTVTGSGNEKTVTFEIDPASANKASTVVYGFDPISGQKSAWATPIQDGWGQKAVIYKAVFKEGITAINGGVFALNRTVQTVELPKTLVTITGESAFQGCHALKTVYIAGNAPVEGTLDFSCVTSYEGGTYTFDNLRSADIKALKLAPELTGSLGTEWIKYMVGLTELEIPAGVTTLADKSLSKTDNLKTLTILGMETVISSDVVFNDNTAYPTIKAKAGSKAAEFALANGYTFVDLDTGVETKGTKPAPGTNTGGTTGGNTGGTTNPADGVGLQAFNPDEATAYGYIGGQYYDTYWVYYQDIKTLKFFSNLPATSGKWNETGRIDKCEDQKGWTEYKDEIEYVEIGPQLAKVTGSAFANHTALKEVKLGPKISQIDAGAFSGCSSLTTVWYEGGEKVEGRCDLTKVAKVNTIMDGTAFKEVLLSSQTATITGALSFGLETILTPNVTDSLIQFAKENGYNLQSTTDPNVKYEYWIPVPTGAIMCGARCAYYFDEATATLTVYGSGAIDDIVNYHGGGSKTSPWFEIKQNIKHVVLTEYITAVGKYAFAECENLETVQIPNVEGFQILNAAFESCSSLKSIYVAGKEPIEGTLDLSPITGELPAWVFANDYLIANVIISSTTDKIGKSTFDMNIDVNLKNVYGTPGTFAEEWANKNGKTFFDIASNTPEPITCVAPVIETESVAATDTNAPDSETAVDTGAVTTEPIFDFEDETEAPAESTAAGDPAVTEKVPAGNTTDDTENGGNAVLWIVIGVAAVAVVAVAVIIIAKSKKK